MKLLNLVACCLLGCAALAQPEHAQSLAPVQTKTFFGEGGTDYDITLDQPVTPGDALVVEVYAAQGYPWSANILCALQPYWCNWYMLDSQGNRFQQVNEDYWGTYYVPAAKGGRETISIYYSVPNNISVVVMEFPVSLMLVDVTPPRCDQNPVNGQPTLCDPRRGTNSSISSDNTATPSSYTITSTFANELFVGNGQLGNRFESFTGLNGWSDPAWGGEVYLNYLFVPNAGTAVTDTFLSSPPLAEGRYIYMSIAGFKTARH